uniref:Uncharacterized protein n=1 Tax=Human herpesvirus 1 TaxID=10298 RepID=A0A2Z4H4C5_HHV1|nr:hypothetical protein [Human alphaherpesvirus 1]AWW09478.1 hypothetical protein [Human alphaherpesvirus 1]AWW10942.1 hypothetical protein [Human alphaherpesvirus 1]
MPRSCSHSELSCAPPPRLEAAHTNPARGQARTNLRVRSKIRSGHAFLPPIRLAQFPA